MSSLQNLSPPFDHLRALQGNIDRSAQSFPSSR